MRHLLRKQIICIVIACIFLNFHASAQFKQLNREGHDNMPYYFGLSISYNNATLHPSKNPRFLENDSILSVEPGAKGGISLGLQATFRINKRFEFRANPQLIVGGAKFFTYTLKNPLPTEADTVIQNLPSTIVSFPLQIKFNSDRIDNFRVYMLGGIKYDLDLASNSSARNAENFVKLKKGDFGLEAG
ncbi:MAG: outer membrane beta-barrel protein, partial [Chitinophagaceae bacterium]